MPSGPVRASFHSITPLVPAGPDLAEAVAFYTEQMGFAVVWQGDSMAGLARDGIAINLVQNDNREWAENASFSIAVSDLEALYEEYRHVPARIGPLEMKVWGRREFHMIVPPAVAFQFYQRQDA